MSDVAALTLEPSPAPPPKKVKPSRAKRPKPRVKVAGEAARPSPGPQERFLECGAYEALYGGAAGGGKSWALLAAALRYIDHPSYRGLLLRRTFPDLRRSLLVQSRQLYRDMGGTFNAQSFEWRFQSGAIIEFSSLQRDDDVHRYQSAEYSFIGFDELTTFSQFQYTYMQSRLRSAHGLPLRLRAATNPGGYGHDWVLQRFAPWLYPEGVDEYKGPRASPEERLYYALINDQDVIVPRGHRNEDGIEDALGRVFFPALVSDNPYLAGTQYELNLNQLDPLTRARLKHGNWMARASAGVFFKTFWFPVIGAAPTDVKVRVRYWDRAATVGTGADWTAGLLLCQTHEGEWIVEDVVHFQGTPGEVQKTIKATAVADALRPGTPVACFLEQDPAAAGKFEAAAYLAILAAFGVRFAKPIGDKITRANVPSAQAEARNIKLVRGSWNAPFLAELEGFPDGHDDQVDALSGAMRVALLLISTDRAAIAATTIQPSEIAGRAAPADDQDEERPEPYELG